MNATGWILFLLAAIGIAFAYQTNHVRQNDLERRESRRLADYQATMQGRIAELQKQADTGEAFVKASEEEHAKLDTSALTAAIAEQEAALVATREKLATLKGDIANVSSIWRRIQEMQRDPAVRDAAPAPVPAMAPADAAAENE